MQIHINGEAREFSNSLTVSELLAALSVDGKRLAVEVNGAIVPRSTHAERRINDGDKIEIVHAIGGGG